MKLITPSSSLFISLLVTLGLVSPASAIHADKDHKPYYLGGQLDLTRLKPETKGTVFDAQSNVEPGAGLFVGYELTDRHRAQLTLDWLGKAELKQQVTGGDSSIDYTALSLELHQILYKPDDKNWNLYAGAGVSAFKNAGSDVQYDKEGDAQLSLLAGLESSLNHQWSLRAQLKAFSGDALAASLGLVRYFGGQPAHHPKPMEQAHDCVVSSMGCDDNNPNGDDDADGVINALDRCADTYPNLKVDEVGCALFDKSFNNIHFDLNSARLKADATRVLDEIAIEMQKVPYLMVEVQAHTDSSGTSSYNLWLSNKRAQSIVDYLVLRGVEKGRMIAKGYGETELIADEAVAGGKALNRRAEFRVIRDLTAEPADLMP